MPGQPDYRYDLFVSFEDGDRDWVQGYLLPALGLAKERVIASQHTKHTESPQPGAEVVAEFERAVTSSRYTLLVLSRAFLADRFSTFGERLASYAAVAEQRDRLIPLLIERDCSLPLHIQFRVSLDCTERDNWESEIGRLRELLAQPEPKPERIPCPYPGMFPFSEKDAQFFYGRENEIKQVLQHFRNQRMLFVIGPSGCGKSSLVFAGLVPQLRSSPYFDEGFWLIKQMRPGPQPVEELCAVLGGDAKSESVGKLVAANPPARRLLLTIDQFEELFSQAERSEQNGFIAALKRLRAAESCALLITMRADFYPELMNSDLWEEASTSRMEIAPLRGDRLREAIEKPAGDAGVYLERRLADKLVSDAAEEPGALPLLQETMRLLWAEMARRFLSLRAYEQLGKDGRSGLAVAIANKADATMNNLPGAEQKAIARRIFLRLVQFGEGRPDTRRQQVVSTLLSPGDDPERFEQTLRHLKDNRLVTLTGEEGGQKKKVDLAHEALISGWPQLQEWLQQRRGAEQTRRRLEEEKAKEWVRLDRKGGLLDEVELKEAEQWAQGPDAADLGRPSADLEALLKASRTAIEQERQAREAARQHELEQTRALVEEQRQRAEAAQRLALNAMALALAGQAAEMAGERPEQNDLPALLAYQAHLFSRRSGDYATDRVDRALRAALELPHFAGSLPAPGNRATAAAFDSAGRWLAVGGADGTIEIWALAQLDAVHRLLREKVQSPRAVLKGDGAIHWVAFSCYGRSLAAIGAGGAVHVWRDWTSPSAPTLLGHTDLLGNPHYPPIPPFAVSSDLYGHHLAFQSAGNIEVWSISWDQEPALAKRFVSGPCRSVALRDRPIPEVVLVSAVEPVVTILGLKDGSKPAIVRHPRKWVLQVSDREASLLPVVVLSPDGRLLAQCPRYRSSSGRVAIWSLTIIGDEPEPEILRNGEYWCNYTWQVGRQDPMDFVREGGLSMQFDSQSQYLAVGQRDEIRLWDIHRPDDEPRVLRGSGTDCLAFTPDSDLLAAGREQVRLWRLKPSNTTSTILTTNGKAVRAVGFSPNSEWLVSCDADRRLRLWNLLHIDDDPIVVDLHTWPGRFAFRELTARDANWQVRTLRLGFPITFSPDGQRLAFAIVEESKSGEREALAMIDLRKPEAPTIKPAPLVTSEVGAAEKRRLPVFASVFETAGQSVLSFDFDDYTFRNASDAQGPIRIGFVRRWDFEHVDSEPTLLSEIRGLEPLLTFGADGRFLVSATNERGQRPETTVLVWEVSQPQAPPAMLGKMGGIACSIAYASSGQSVAVGGENGDIAVWAPGKPESPPIVLSGHVGRVFALAFSPDGGTLASGSEDKTIRLWNLRQPRTNPVVLRGHDAGVASVAFSPDGRLLASGGDDGTVRLWIAETQVLADLVREQLTRGLTQDEWRQFIGDQLQYETLAPRT
jgi:WD40 repeat protein/energy-coupling factor transporter ATP-binding protein EcfA2